MAFSLKGILSLDTSGFSSGISNATSSIDGLKSKTSSLSSDVSGVGKNMGLAGSRAREAASGISAFSDKASSVGGASSVASVGVGELAGKLGKFFGIAYLAKKGLDSLTTGFGQAFDMQGYRNQLETATKDTQRAGQLMSDAIKYANETPFETGEVVKATASLEAYGLSSQKWLKPVGDMAGATNKSIDQAMEAVADMATGEYERLKEFGITKKQIMAAAEETYGAGSVFSKGGELLDEAKGQDVVLSIMEERFKGGAEKQAKTVKGMWSTIKGTFETGMARIVGISTEGETAGNIIEGSLLDKVSKGAQKLVGVFDSLDKAGVFTGLGDALGFISDKAVEVFDFLSPYFQDMPAVFGPLVEGLKEIGTSLLESFGNTDLQGYFSSVLDFLMDLGQLASSIFGNIIVPAIQAVIPVLASFVKTVMSVVTDLAGALSGVIDFIYGVFTGNWSLAWDGIKTIFFGVINAIKDSFSGLLNTFSSTVKGISGFASKLLSKIGKAKSDSDAIAANTPANANGTSYFSGGASLVNERGGEMQVLRNGTSIIPADRTQQLLEGGGGTGTTNYNTFHIDASGMNVNELVSQLQLRLANI